MMSPIVLGSSPATFSQVVSEGREWWFSPGSYHVIWTQAVPPLRAEGMLYTKQRQVLKCISFPSYGTGCRSTMLVYGWIKSHFSHTTVTVLQSCFGSGCLHRPSFFHINIQCWVLLKKMQERWNWIFNLETGVLPLPPVSTQMKPQGRRPWDQCRSCCGLQLPPLQCHGDPGMATGKLWWQGGSGGCPVAQMHPADLKPFSPKPCSSPTMVQPSGDAAARWQTWFTYRNVKKGSSLVPLSAISMTTNKPAQSRNWWAAKCDRVSYSPQEAGREQSANQTWFSSCFPYKAVWAWPVAQATLQSCLLAPCDSFPYHF